MEDVQKATRQSQKSVGLQIKFQNKWRVFSEFSTWTKGRTKLHKIGNVMRGEKFNIKTIRHKITCEGETIGRRYKCTKQK